MSITPHTARSAVAWRAAGSAAALALTACATGPGPQVPGDRAATSAEAPRQLAFPGAEGEGRHALGGRGGRVFTVRHLDDAGPGSLREAIDAEGPRTVVFAVSGTIALSKPLNVRHGRLTIAGQTAPGDGITLRNHALSINADDVVVRFIRSRMGDESAVDDDALSVGSGRRIIIDHVSTSWSTDETLSVSADFKGPERSYQDVTVQWSFITESLNCTAVKPRGCHGFGSLLRGGLGSRLSMHHNLWAHHKDRMPRPGNYTSAEGDPIGSFYDFRNNVFYNWGEERAGYNMDRGGELSTYNFVNNAYVRGPSSRKALAFEESNDRARAHFAGNSMDGVLPADPWSLVVTHRGHRPEGLPPAYRLAQPHPMAPVVTDSAAEAFERVLRLGGASLVRDAVDRRIVDDVRLRRGRLIDSQQQVGGWPVLASRPAPVDSDGDGMPDEWERGRGLNPHDASDGARVDAQTGWTALELYLNGLVAHLIR